VSIVSDCGVPHVFLLAALVALIYYAVLFFADSSLDYHMRGSDNKLYSCSFHSLAYRPIRPTTLFNYLRLF